MWIVGMKPWSSARATSVLSLWAIPPAPMLSFLNIRYKPGILLVHNQTQPFPSGLKTVSNDSLPGARGSPQVRVGSQNETFYPSTWYLPILAYFVTYSQNSASLELLISLEDSGSLLTDFTEQESNGFLLLMRKMTSGKIRAIDACPWPMTKEAG